MSFNAAYVALLTNNAYLPGLLVLDYGLKHVQSKYPFIAMVTSEFPQDGREILRKRGIPIHEVKRLEPSDDGGDSGVAATDARFGDTWTKLEGFGLTQYDRVVLLDSDMLVKKNMDDLMEIPLPAGGIAAIHVCACNPRRIAHYPADWIPANCAHTCVPHPTAPPVKPSDQPRPHSQLNGGMIVLDPSMDLYRDLVHFLVTDERIATFSFPDQDLLTTVFHDKWVALPWYYNALKTLRNAHSQLWDDDVVRCVHYILTDKPWQSRTSGKDFEVVNGWWWDQFTRLGEEMQVADADGWRLVSTLVAK